MIDKMKAESEPLLKADSDLLVGREDRALAVDCLQWLGERLQHTPRQLSLSLIHI